MAERLEAVGCQLVGVESNLVDVVWAADPTSPQPARWRLHFDAILKMNHFLSGLKNQFSRLSSSSLEGRGRVRWKRSEVR